MKSLPFYLMMNKLYTMKYKQYAAYVQKIIHSDWFKIEIKSKNIEVKYFEQNMTNKYLNIYFEFCCDNIIYKEKIAQLININLKNSTIYQVGVLLQQLQQDFIESGFIKDLKFYKRNYFLTLYMQKFNSYIDLSILSKVLNYNFIYVYNVRYSLNVLLPKKTHFYAMLVKSIIAKNPRIKDKEISQILAKKYGLDYSRKQVCNLRAKHLIPAYNKRESGLYLMNEKFYTEKILLTKESVKKVIPKTSGIYELCTSDEQNYSLTKSSTVYIGSSNNLKNRLYTYSMNNGHTERIREFIQANTIYCRYIKIYNHKENEKIFLNNFKYLTGDLPLLNNNNIY